MWHFKDKTNIRHIDFKDKESVTRLLVMSMLQRTNSMFEWKGLPPTIPQDILETQLQVNGFAGIIKTQEKLFAVYGGVGGQRNYNYQPTLFIVSNPYLLKQSESYTVFYGNDSEIESPLKPFPSSNEKCVIIQNDNMYSGLIPLCEYYASQMTENVVSKRMATIALRAMYLFTANDEDAKNDFIDVMNKLTNGEFAAILAEGVMGGSIKDVVATLPFADRGHEALTDLIEDQQYIKASWYNDLGLQANYNMKRESINSGESQLNKDAILPFVDNMLRQRKLACERINELYGTNWSVEFSSAWGYTRDTIEQALDAIDDSSEMKLGSEDEKTDDQISGQEVEDEQVSD